MKLRSLYEFYRKYFNYPSTKNRLYGRAVSQTNMLVKECLQNKSIIPILQYHRGEYVNPITVKLINRLVELAEENYASFFNQIEYFETWVSIDKQYLNTRRRGIEIPIIGGIDRGSKTFIMLSYGSSLNLLEENRVLRGLLREFSVTKKWPVGIERVTYWNLSRGEIRELDTRIVFPVERDKLIEAANKL